MNCWYEITDYTIRQKVSQTLREALIQRDPEKRKLYNKKRVEKRAIQLAANSYCPPELAVLPPAHAKQLQQLTASQETPSLAPASLLTMPTLPTRLNQANLIDLVDETLGLALDCIRPDFPVSMSSEDWFTAGDIVGNDSGDSDLSSFFW